VTRKPPPTGGGFRVVQAWSIHGDVEGAGAPRGRLGALDVALADLAGVVLEVEGGGLTGDGGRGRALQPQVVPGGAAVGGHLRGRGGVVVRQAGRGLRRGHGFDARGYR